MRIRNLMAPIVALTVCGVAAQAQNPPTSGQNPQNPTSQDTSRNQNQSNANGQQNDARSHVNQLLEGITLTAQQRSKVDSIVQRFALAQPGGVNQGSVSQNPQQSPSTQEPQDTLKSSSSSSSSASTSSSSDTATTTRSYGGQTGVSQFAQLDAQVRAVLTPEQQNIWDRNVGTLRNQGNPKR